MDQERGRPFAMDVSTNPDIVINVLDPGDLRHAYRLPKDMDDADLAAWCLHVTKDVGLVAACGHTTPTNWTPTFDRGGPVCAACVKVIGHGPIRR